jgi:hypothetical protein
VLRESTLPFLREDERPVVEHVELALATLGNRGVEAALPQLGRETRGPSVVPASDGAVVDLDAHAHSLADARDATTRMTRPDPMGEARLLIEEYR